SKADAGAAFAESLGQMRTNGTTMSPSTETVEQTGTQQREQAQPLLAALLADMQAATEATARLNTALATLKDNWSQASAEDLLKASMGFNAAMQPVLNRLTELLKVLGPAQSSEAEGTRGPCTP